MATPRSTMVCLGRLRKLSLRFQLLMQLCCLCRCLHEGALRVVLRASRAFVPDTLQFVVPSASREGDLVVMMSFPSQINRTLGGG